MYSYLPVLKLLLSFMKILLMILKLLSGYDYHSINDKWHNYKWILFSVHSLIKPYIVKYLRLKSYGGNTMMEREGGRDGWTEGYCRAL